MPIKTLKLIKSELIKHTFIVYLMPNILSVTVFRLKYNQLCGCLTVKLFKKTDLGKSSSSLLPNTNSALLKP